MRVYHVISLLIAFVTCSQAQQYSFTTLTTANGLSQNDVNSILQDSRGFMWFGTYDGLNKYDGYEFIAYQTMQNNTNSLCGNLIHTLREGENNEMWITTENAGLSRLNLLTNEIINLGNSEATPHLFQTNRLEDIEYFPGGYIWLETQRGISLLKYNSDGTYWSKDITPQTDMLGQLYSQRRMRTLFKDNDSCIWLVTHGGIGVLHLNQQHAITRMDEIQFYDNKFECVIHCPEGYLIGAISGLYFLTYTDRTRNRYRVAKLDTIVPTCMCVDNFGKLWVGTTNGIYVYHYTPGTTRPYTLNNHFTMENSNLASHKIRCIYKSQTGILWFGTNGGGVALLDQNKPNFRHYPVITDKNQKHYSIKCSAIYEDQRGNLWIGSDNHGLFFLPNTSNRQYSQECFRFQPNEKSLWHAVYFIQDVHTNQGNFLWAGCSFNNVLVEIDLKKWGTPQFMHPIEGLPEMCFQMTQGRDSLIWIASYWGGLYRYDPYSELNEFDRFLETNSDLPSNIVRSVLEDDAGRIWVGTSHGLCRIDKKDKRNEQLRMKIFTAEMNTPGSLSHNYILPIRETSDNTIWIGTMGGGLNKYQPPSDSTLEGFVSYTTEQGLPNNVIKEIIEDNNGNLWLASNKGLTRFNPKTEKISIYDKNDGLQDNEFSELSGCKLKSGEILFGGVNGFNAFFPEEIKEDTTLPIVAFTHIDIQGIEINIHDTIHGRELLTRQLNETQELQLRYNENNFSVHFSGLHYSSPLKNQYRYFLKGFDKRWNSTNALARFAKYTNLEPGQYTLQVLASNGNNNWTSKAKEIRIIIRPPFWKTWLFRLLLLLFTALALLFVYRFRIRQLTRELQRRKEHERVLTLAKTKAEESDSLKSAIIANLSHEIRTPVNGIFGFSELLSLENLSTEKRQHYSKIVRQRCNDLTKVLDSVLLLSSAQSGTLKAALWDRPLGTVLTVVLAEARDVLSAKKKNVRITLQDTGTDLKQIVLADHHKIHYVLSSLLDNAIKFTEKGNIEVCCKIVDGMIEFSVRDTGIGIPEQYQKLIFEEFRQTSIGLSRQYGGIGLGLSLCKTYVIMMGGKIWLDSVEGEGSIFYFTVPYRPA